MQTPLQDADIIRSVLQGRKNDFAMLVSRYQHFVFTITMRFVPDRHDAEEVAQDVFVKAFLALADYKMQSKFSTWLYTITHRTCVSHMRKKKNTIISTDDGKLSAIGEQLSGISNTAQVINNKMQKQFVEAAIKELDADDAEIITLFYTCGQSLEEIGIIMGMTANNAKIRLYRARQKMRVVLERKYGKELNLLYNE